MTSEPIKRTLIPHSGLAQFFAEDYWLDSGKWLEVEAHEGLISIRGPSSDHRDLSKKDVEVMRSLLDAAIDEVEK